MKNILLLITGLICFQAYCPNTATAQGCPTPIPGFQYYTNGLTATFMDSSSVTGAATYSWDFGDGTGTSTGTFTNYTFSTAGTYWVCLFVQDSCGHDLYCDSVTVTDPCAPDANFISFVFNQLYVDFYDVSNTTGLTAYSWDFGDGLGTSTAQHPSYTYNVPGFYQV